MLNSISSASNLESSVLASLRPEHIRELVEQVFPELRDIAAAKNLEQRHLYVRRLEQRLLSKRGQDAPVLASL